MSLDPSKQRIVCDSSDCAQNTPLPIILPDRTTTQHQMRGGRSSAAGWFFVASLDGDRHYCPRCGRKLYSRNAV